MATNYFKTTWRSLVRDRQFAILNLAGLSVALACVLLIYLWVSDERSVDRFNLNSNRLYQVMAHIKLPDGIHTQESTPYLLSRALAKQMPEVEDAVCLYKSYSTGTIAAGDKHIKTTRYYADRNFFTLFNYSLLEGDKHSVLNDKYAVLLSDKLALKLFGSTAGVAGKTIQWENEPQSFTVSGIFAAPGSSSSLQFDVLFTYEFFYQGDTTNANNWSNSNPSTFLLLKKGTDAKQVEKKLTGFLHAKYADSPLTLSMRKFEDRYLYDLYENGVVSGGRIRYVNLFSLIAVFILGIACINFMNLSTAKAARRLKDAGIKKLLGAKRTGIVFQYIAESMLMVFISLVIALVLVVSLLPSFNAVTGKQLSIPLDGQFVTAVVATGLFAGLLAGSYPALYLSGFKPVQAIKGKLNTVWGELWVRKGLVVFQYSLSVLFIIAVMVVYRQMHLIRTIDLGYNKDHILSFENEKKIGDSYGAFIKDVQQVPGVTAASSFGANMWGGSSGNTEHSNWEGNLASLKIQFTALDMDYGLTELLGMKMVAGRSFSKQMGADSLGIILNEAAVNAMDMKDPVGKWFDVWGGHYQIIGVAKDFHFESLYEKVKPCFMRCIVGGKNILVKISGSKEWDVVARLESIYKKYNPGLPFGYSFMDMDYQAMYIAEQRESVLLRCFATLAILISCLGLFGLSAFSAQKRQKEMSIRKVVGASSADIAALLSKDFFQLVLVATIISFPVSWWTMSQWLNNFAYRVNIGTGVFLLAFVFVIVITIITISFQSVKAALSNPVKSLRVE